MSYKQILHRATRILKSKLGTMFEPEEANTIDQEWFDEELKRRREQQERWDEHTHRSHERESQNTQKEKRKPGEQSDEHYLAILGLRAAATNAEIRAAYKKLIAMHHPDRAAKRGAADQEAALKKSKEINEAYQVLKRRRKE